MIIPRVEIGYCVYFGTVPSLWKHLPLPELAAMRGIGFCFEFICDSVENQALILQHLISTAHQVRKLDIVGLTGY